MGVFRHPVLLWSRRGDHSEATEALVGSGASYTLAPTSLLERLGVERQFERDFVLADGRRVRLGLGIVDVQIDGQRMPTPCIFGEEGAETLLGAVTLEQFGLGVDPLGRKLIPVPGYLTLLRR